MVKTTRWEPERNFNKLSGNMIDQFWAKVNLGDRDRTDLSQFTKIGEEFFPTNRPRTIPPSFISGLPLTEFRIYSAKNQKRKVSLESVASPPSKIQRVDEKSDAGSEHSVAEDSE